MTAHDPRVTLTEAERDDLDDAWQEAAWSRDLHPAVERIIAARLAPIRALANEWEAKAATFEEAIEAAWAFDGVLDDLHAALDAPVSASQDHDGAEGQSEGEEALSPGREVRFGVVLDDQGSTDEYDTYGEARAALDRWGGDGIVRIERTVALWLEESR